MYTKLIVLLLPLMAQGAPYSAEKAIADGIEVVRLRDAAHHAEVSIAPSIGNMVYEFKVNGKNLLWFPFSGPAEWKAKLTPCAIPFLAPWANRLDTDGFWANDRRYILNPGLGNLRRDDNGRPIHGVLYFSSAWSLVSVEADAHSARAVSRLEFWKYPDMMAQFPFAHTITITHRLAGGVLEVETQIQNHSLNPMPVAIGFHPFFRLHDSPRPQWSVHIAARRQMLLSKEMLPTGKQQAAGYSDPQPLAGKFFDDDLTDLARGPDGRAVFWLQGKREKISVALGPKYPVAVIFTPPDKEAVCVEPMTAVTNAFNLAHQGLYDALQSIPPGGEWKESFWIAPEGF